MTRIQFSGAFDRRFSFGRTKAVAGAVICLFAVLLGHSCFTSSSSAQGVATAAPCSPVLINPQGQVSISCSGIPDEALRTLAKSIEDANLARRDAQKAADEWAVKYVVLSERFQSLALTLGSKTVESAGIALKSGELDKASPEISALEISIQEQKANFRKSNLQLMELLSKNGVKFGGVISNRDLWSKSSIEICFMGGETRSRRKIAEIGSQWLFYGNLNFDFGSDVALRTCNTEKPSDVRIAINDYMRSFWSYRGQSALAIDKSDPTMSIPIEDKYLKTGRILNWYILHEFGHMLGLEHIYVHPEYCMDEIDWEYIEKKSHNAEFLRKQMILVDEENDYVTVGQLDVKSVMQFEFPKEYYKKGTASRCYPGDVDGLSPLDQLAMFQAYPFD
jgi:hypothetical protein